MPTQKKGKSYIQFDFSKINSSKIDTTILLDIASNVFFPDTIVTYDDIRKLYAAKGKFFDKVEPLLFLLPGHEESDFSNALFVNLDPDSLSNDSVLLHVDLFVTLAGSEKKSNNYYRISSDTLIAFNNFTAGFKSEVGKDLMNVETQRFIPAGSIVNYFQGTAIIRLNGEVRLSLGSRISYFRTYVGKPGLDSEIEDMKEGLLFSLANDSEMLGFFLPFINLIVLREATHPGTILHFTGASVLAHTERSLR